MLTRNSSYGRRASITWQRTWPEVPGGKLTSTQVRALVETLRDIVTVLAEAQPQDKANLYGELGVDLTYHPEGRGTVEMYSRWVKVCVGGGS